MKWITPDWPSPLHIKAYTTLRHSFTGRTDTNTLTALLKLPYPPHWLDQTHSAIVIPAKNIEESAVADAIFSEQAKQICAVLTADCLPILICDRLGTKVAAIHAGWRGLAKGIISATVQKLNLPGSELLAWLGPAIGPTKFEVGPDVYDAFTQIDPHTEMAFKISSKAKWHANLYQLATIFLNNLGITAIFGGNFCTYTQADLFFSYRRGDTGRLASLIWIEDK